MFIDIAVYGSAIIEWWTGNARSRKTEYFVVGLAPDNARRGGVSGSSKNSFSDGVELFTNAAKLIHCRWQRHNLSFW